MSFEKIKGKLGFGCMRLKMNGDEVDYEEFSKMIEKHGEDRILFASDSPWQSQKADVERLRAFSLGKDTEEKIFSENAKKLLKI